MAYSGRETKKTNGIAHFLEHLFFRGGKRYPTQEATTAAVERCGGYMNAYTSLDMVQFDIQMPANKFETGMDVLSDMLLNAALRKEDIEMERGAILQEIAGHEDSPSNIAYRLFMKSLYGDTPFGRPIIGPKKNVERFSQDNLFAFRSLMYNAQDSVLAIVADISTDEILRLAQKYFADMPHTSAGFSVKDKRPIPLGGPHITLRQKDFEQVALVLGVSAPDHFAEGRLESIIIDYILSGGMSSRLFQNIRSKRGLAYSVSSSYWSSVDYGGFSCDAKVDSSKVEEALGAILEELKRLTDEPIGIEELRRAQEQRSGGLALSCDNSSSIADKLIHTELLFQQAKTAFDLIHETDCVTAEGLQHTAQQLFGSNRLHLVVVGPYKGNRKTLMSVLTT